VSPSASSTAENRSKVQVILSWTFVLVPLAWGVTQTLVKSVATFTQWLVRQRLTGMPGASRDRHREGAFVISRVADRIFDLRCSLRPFLVQLREMAGIMRRRALDDQFPWLQRVGIVASRRALSGVP
jgi:hypothetical protein